MKNKRDSFEHSIIQRVSVAAAPLAAWVKANLEFKKAQSRSRKYC